MIDKPRGLRNLAFFWSGIVVWLIAIAVMGLSQTLYFMLTAAAIALFIFQAVLNSRIRRAGHGS